MAFVYIVIFVSWDLDCSVNLWWGKTLFVHSRFSAMVLSCRNVLSDQCSGK